MKYKQLFKLKCSVDNVNSTKFPKDETILIIGDNLKDAISNLNSKIDRTERVRIRKVKHLLTFKDNLEVLASDKELENPVKLRLYRYIITKPDRLIYAIAKSIDDVLTNAFKYCNSDSDILFIGEFKSKYNRLITDYQIK